ncbi:hypothetical protein [Ralstonia sp. ASV6]|uniref:hypothetical protein n=1 Tax=Ralstonia sp. ASV6 TaxID=2795124 RepID=UPI0018EDA7A4|nr:hypothetical protein [Ralstonia sp. ASV6]
MRDILVMVKPLAVALLLALFGMAVWQWGEPPIELTYGCFGGPSGLDVYFREFQLHSKATAVGSGTLLAAALALTQIRF